MKKHLAQGLAVAITAALCLVGCSSGTDGQPIATGTSISAPTTVATTATPSTVPTGIPSTPATTSTRASAPTTAGSPKDACAKVEPAAQKACWYYLNRAVPARVRFYKDSRSPDAIKSRAANTDLDAWYRTEPGNLGQANPQIKSQVAAWDPNIRENIDETHSVIVTGGSGATSARVATLTTTESWNVHTEGTSLVLDSSVAHTVTLLRQADGVSWTVSSITGLLGVG